MLKHDIKTTFGGAIIHVVLGIAGASILARVLGPSGRGLFALAILIPSVLSVFLDLGQSTVNATFGGLYKDKRRSLFLQSLIITLLGTIVGVIVILAFFFWLPINLGQFKYLSKTIIFIIIFATPFTLFSIMMIELVRGTGQVSRAVFITIVSKAVYLLGLVVFLVLIPGELLNAVLVFALSPLLSILLSLLYLPDVITINLSYVSYFLFKRSLRFGILTSLDNIGTFLIYRVDRLMLAYMVPFEQLGLYVISVSVAEQLRLLPRAISSAFLPRLANESVARQSQVPAVFRYTVIVTIISMLLITVLGPPAIVIVFGWAYVGSIMPFLVLLPGIVALGGSSILSSDLLVREKPQYGMWISWIGVCLNIGLNFFLIPLLGITGAALASTITYIAAFCIVVCVFHRESGTPFGEMIPHRKDYSYVVHSVIEMVESFFRKFFPARFHKKHQKSIN